ncbi:MAG: hypothetical protein JJ966_09230 [Balneolaceae bacterium]|jgi:hypothetical protein|nr:hypothetical protein [Balneolaceae bacterium]MCR9133238.1 hypothetical protein [bacterium]
MFVDNGINKSTDNLNIDSSMYNISPPTAKDAYNAIVKIIGEAQAKEAWMQACTACRLTKAPQNLMELKNVLQAISSKNTLASVPATSLLIKIRSYEGITKKSA